MWAYVTGGSVQELYTKPKAIKIGNNQYPQNIFSLWSVEELQSIGIYPVTIDSTNLKNQEYLHFWLQQHNFFLFQNKDYPL